MPRRRSTQGAAPEQPSGEPDSLAPEAVPGAAVRRSRADWIGIVVIVGAIGAVLTNALFMQSGPHPAPIFGAKARPVMANEATGAVLKVFAPRPRPAELAGSRPDNSAVHAPAAPRANVAANGGVSRPDAIGSLLVTSSRRVLAVQRALLDFGYGPIKPNGILGADTKAAIERFERDRKLPVTGQISERMMRELAAVTGRSFE